MTAWARPLRTGPQSKHVGGKRTQAGRQFERAAARRSWKGSCSMPASSRSPAASGLRGAPRGRLRRAHFAPPNESGDEIVPSSKTERRRRSVLLIPPASPKPLRGSPRAELSDPGRSPARGSTPRRTQPLDDVRDTRSVGRRCDYRRIRPMHEAEERQGRGPGEGERRGLDEALVDHEGGDRPRESSPVDGARRPRAGESLVERAPPTPASLAMPIAAAVVPAAARAPSIDVLHQARRDPASATAPIAGACVFGVLWNACAPISVPIYEGVGEIATTGMIASIGEITREPRQDDPPSDAGSPPSGRSGQPIAFQPGSADV